MLLAVDVGNTQTVFGLFNDADLTEHWRIATERNRSGDEPSLTAEALAEKIGESLTSDDDL